LHNEVIPVLVHHERWQKVGLRVHDSESGRVQIQGCAKAQRVLKARTKQREVGDDLAACEHAQRNLRAVAEECIADRAAARADNVNNLAAFCLHLYDVRGVHPRMSATDAPLAACGHDDSGGDHAK
jgi:hypothetical protein